MWLFSSGPLGTEVKDGEPQPKEIAEFQEAIRPRDQRIFFGALDYNRLSFAERMMVKAVRAPEGDFRGWEMEYIYEFVLLSGWPTPPILSATQV